MNFQKLNSKQVAKLIEIAHALLTVKLIEYSPHNRVFTLTIEQDGISFTANPIGWFEMSFILFREIMHRDNPVHYMMKFTQFMHDFTEGKKHIVDVLYDTWQQQLQKQ
jgi:hypothetical protein